MYRQEVATVRHAYNDLNHDSYHNVIYIVKPGDTLFYIAWITGNSCAYLAKINNIKDVNVLKIGQVLKIYPKSEISYFRMFINYFFVPVYKCSFFLKKKICFINKNSFLFVKKNKDIAFNINRYKNDCFYTRNSNIAMNNMWNWPTCGRVINTFSDSERGSNKGIDISGKFGQPILATAKGRVIYVGNALQGYGNLIIIKHDDDYFSAYAHNDVVLVTERQIVSMGDKIATMGNSGTNEVKLHFQIRYKGQSVNPLCYLPKN